jgi:hypothetical protein
MSFQRLLFLLATCGSVSATLAQRPAVAPLAPVVPVIAAPRQLGIEVPTKSPARPAAPAFDQPSRTVRPQPVFLINSHVIVGSGLAKVNPQDIADITVYKGFEAPAKWRSLTENGILAITLKPHVKPALKTESFAKIGKRLTLRVATADIARLDTQQTGISTVVNIHLVVPPPVVHPPGTIMIRGASGS